MVNVIVGDAVPRGMPWEMPGTMSQIGPDLPVPHCFCRMRLRVEADASVIRLRAPYFYNAGLTLAKL